MSFLRKLSTINSLFFNFLICFLPFTFLVSCNSTYKGEFEGQDNKHRYKVGKGNLIDMLILSKTNHMLFATSNIPYTAIFYSNKRFPHSIIDNGMKGNIFISQVSWYIRKNLPSFLGGFKNKFKNINT